MIDLSQLTLGRPAARRLSTRIVARALSRRRRARRSLLGLIAEKATETVRREPADFVAVRRHAATGAPYLGPVATDARGLRAVDRRGQAAAGLRARRVVQTPWNGRWPLADFEDLLKAVDRARRRLDRLVGDRARRAGAAVGLRPRQTATPIWERVRASPTELQALIEAVVVPETWFFRDREAFAALARIGRERLAAGARRRRRCAC